MVSEELGIDEVIAAELVFNASDDLDKLDMSPLQGGVALFHVRRQYILDLIRCFLVQSAMDDRASGEFKKVVKTWSEGGVLINVLDALKSVEEGYVEVNEKEKRGQFLGQIHNSEFVQLLKLRRDFLLREHDFLGQILCGLVQNKLIDGKGFVKLLERVREFGDYDTMFVHYIPSILLYLSTYDPVLSGTGYSVEFEQAYNGYKEILDDGKEWKLDYWKGALSLAMLSGFSGCCKAEPGRMNSNGVNNLISHGISYELSILDPTKKAIDIGGIEFLMVLAANISKTLSKKPHFYDYRASVQNKVPSLKRLGDLSDEFLNIFLGELERLVESIITNLADILKEMRLSEEDAFLSLTSPTNGAAAEFGDQDDVDIPGTDLERFFIFISYLYSDRPDASIKFWQDSESSLYGFTTWALQCHISFMAATLCDMLASLASGKDCANAVYQLLKDDSKSDTIDGSILSTPASADQITAAASAFSSGLKTPSDHNSLKRIVNTTTTGYKLTWDIIFDALDYYAKQLQPNSAPPPSSLSMGGLSSGTASQRQNALVLVTDMPELDDDVLLLLSSYFRLITVTITNDPQARLDFTTALGGKNISTIFELLHSQTPLYGSILTTLAGFAESDNEQILYALWTAVDKWAFHSTVYSPDGTVIAPNLPPKERLSQLFRSSSDIVGLITLLEALISPLPPSITQGFPFPQDLGSKYRYPGIWPYVDFVINEVFYASASPTFTLDERLFLQLPCLLFIEHSLELLDPDVTRLSSTLGVNPDLVVRSPSFLSYLYNHPCAPTMSHLFKSKIYNILISIASVGIDEIAELGPDEPLVQAVIHSIRIINDILDLQQIFLDVIVKEFKHGSSSLTGQSSGVGGVSIGPPLQIVSHGLKAFEDVLLFNLPTVTHLALYIGSSNIELASRSLQLLQRLSLSSQFVTTITTDARVKKNRLLSTLETVDESIRIKESFLEQLERPADSYDDFNSGSGNSLPAVEIKLSLLEFIISNLKSRSNEPTTAHFLLGFRTTGDGQLDLDEGRCGIATGLSTFNTIISLLKYGIENISSSDVDYGSSKMANACIEIILLLVQDPLTSQPILQLLRDADFTLSSLKAEPVVGTESLWNGQPFDSLDSSSTIVSFFNHRASLLEYVSLEIHESSQLGSLSLVQRYVDALINLDVNRKFTTINGSNDLDRSAVMLSLLDVLEMPIRDEDPLEKSSIEFFGSNVLHQIFQIVGNPLTSNIGDIDSDNEAEIAELNHLLKLKGLEFVANGKIQSLADDKFKSAVQDIISYFYTSRAYRQIRDTQLRCLRSWSKLALVLVNDANVPTSKRITFVLEIFQTLIPKLIDYSSSDIAFAEVLASLLVSLQHIYQEDSKTGGSELNTAGYDRSHSLFRASLESIQTPLATPELRADLYIICYQYLKSTLESTQAKQIIAVIRSAGDKLLETICGDALSGEGITRLVALVFLEVLFSLSSVTKSTFVQDGLVRYNLLLLLVKSIQRTDQEISNRDSLTPSELFFEFKVFNATLCFLLQVARTRSGANQLIQSGLFDVLDSCEFLNIDLDVGIEISSSSESQLTLAGVSDLKVSFFEILIPVFQTLCAVLLSMGAENEPVIIRARRFLEGHQQLVVAIMKKDMLQTGRDGSNPQLEELVKLTVLLISLTEFVPNL